MKNKEDVLDNMLLEDIDDDGDTKPITIEQEDFARDMFDAIQSIINEESKEMLDEYFTSKKSFVRHYRTHCLGKRSGRVSDKHNVYYDFKDMNRFGEYENHILQEVLDSTNRVYCLYNVKEIGKLYRKLFKGNETINFSFTCGFESNGKEAMIGLHSFSSDVTKNYKGGNTIDLIAISHEFKTITLYPVDANYLQTKLNNVIKNHTNHKISFFFNH